MPTAAKKTNQPSPLHQPSAQTSARKDLIKYIAKEGVLLDLATKKKQQRF